jgi:aspartyl-tRNA(Asn)/glutamyl-tRNA(Gln) amidotransferase subunit A
MALYEITVHEARDLLKRREISSLELTEATLERTHNVEAKIRAFVTVTEERARADAREADRMLNEGTGSSLTGIPMQVKDLISTKGIPTTCASRMLENFVPIYDATVIERLAASSPVLMGKGNMDEFAMGSSTENSAFHPTHNPWDLGRVPGGSSGGGAAAVAAGESLFALGSDTGGSIRQPAALCGVTGLKPTYGLVSRYGLVAFGSSLDQIGPLTRDVHDCALVLNAIAGHDHRDATSLAQITPDYTRALINDVDGLRLGLPKEYFGRGFDPEVEAAVRKAAQLLENRGAKVEECSLPLTGMALAVYYIIAPSECSANLARYDGVKYGLAVKEAVNSKEALEQTRAMGFGPEVKRRIMLGTYALSSGYYDAYYLKAQKVRTLIRLELEDSFNRFDALITPTSPTVAFKLGEKTTDPVAMYQSDVCTLPASIAGIPALSIPCGFSSGGPSLPIGMQLIGPALSEETLLRIAYTYQQETDWHIRRPQL